MLSTSDVWPLFDLTITSPRLVMRIVRDEDLPGIVYAALAGIHDPAVMPFSVPWTDASPVELARGMARHQWELRSGIRPDHWTLNFTVLLDGVAIGTQSIGANGFSANRTVNSGSWLTRSEQGKGYGREMRAALLLFAFDFLGAEAAESGAAVWNKASLGVSRGLGYREGGTVAVEPRPGRPDVMQELHLAVAHFKRPDWEITVAGFEQVRADLLLPVP
ncbi:RimJ/RimL family protein N-acetyltransferase [Arthrobacter stackebrandtii]|uniref:RimJ/RimL family protein N-acetyltransferase n=1 Tax=Arthrobacter stackebrandtii TaxID=272161 RepID=A0ABS4YTU9_9MICC|nr:GNAT family N-acetyltransferase [Arthrobacter stackebrandtii]MBP2411373.1 RimJ/RimL family protein N-acetyltransferase [Arthrobacter stackebrandtii]PYH00334.1 N-acetyltransferase [Arthrobacter stackebrandtii]